MNLDRLLEFMGAAATFFSVIYAVKEIPATWIWASLSAILYCVIYYRAKLLVSAEIQIVYLIISLYGFYNWLRPKQNTERKNTLKIRKGSQTFRLKIGLIILIMTIFLAYMNHTYTQAEYVYLDATLVASAIVAQWLMAEKYLACWYLWIFVNLGYLIIFFTTALWISLILYIILFYFTLKGFQEWHRRFKHDSSTELNS